MAARRVPSRSPTGNVSSHPNLQGCCRLEPMLLACGNTCDDREDDTNYASCGTVDHAREQRGVRERSAKSPTSPRLVTTPNTPVSHGTMMCRTGGLVRSQRGRFFWLKSGYRFPLAQLRAV
jgi:hypothetical protein